MVANVVAMAVQGLSALVIVVTTLGILALLALVAWRRRRAFRRTAARQSTVPLAAEPGSEKPSEQ
jgi:Tfp pilus assembly protein PilX